jgi:hypothetical protein
MTAARGGLPLPVKDLVTALFFLCHDADGEIKAQARQTLIGLPASDVAAVAGDADLHPQLLDFIARLRPGDAEVMEPLLANPAVTAATLAYLAERGEGEILSLLARNDGRLRESPEILEALLANPKAGEALKSRLGGGEESEAHAEEQDDTDREGEPDTAEEGEEGEEENLSKYQMALEMGVSEKIKTALTGDKEWRNIFLKDPNKLVSSAVLKNPRITDGEVLAVAKNKSASEELIRLITLNREWVKSYEIKKALVLHPRTPLLKALRYMDVLTEKDIKNLAKSRGVSQIIVNNARRMLLAKQQKNK